MPSPEGQEQLSGGATACEGATPAGDAGFLGRFAILLPGLLSFCMLWWRHGIPAVTMDGVTYLQIARNLIGGHGLGWQALWAAPLHSILVAAAALLTGKEDLLAAAGLVAPVLGFFLVLAVYFLARQLHDRRTAVVAASLAAVFPHLLTISLSTEGEISYALFLVLAVGLYARAVLRGSFLWGAAAGVSFALAYLARSEGFLVMVLVLAIVTLSKGVRFYRSRVLRLSLAVVLLFFVTSLPYLLFLRQQYGAWVISPKASYVMIWMKSRVYHDNDKGEIGNDELWGLSERGRMRWQEPKGVGDLVEYLLSHPGKSLSVYLHNLSREIPGRIPNNSGMELYPQVFPVYLALAALVAACLSWGTGSRAKKAVVFSPFAILLILPIFTEGWWKYLVPYLPLLLVPAARGIWWVPEILGRFSPTWRKGWWPNLLVFLIVIVLMVRFQWTALMAITAPPANQEVSQRRAMAVESKKAGEWAVRRFGSGINYLVPWSRIVYYLDGYWTALPVADLREVIGYGKAQGAELFVRELAGGETVGELARPLPGFELVDVYRSEQIPYAVGFYRFK